MSHWLSIIKKSSTLSGHLANIWAPTLAISQALSLHLLPCFWWGWTVLFRWESLISLTIIIWTQKKSVIVVRLLFRPLYLARCSTWINNSYLQLHLLQKIIRITSYTLDISPLPRFLPPQQCFWATAELQYIMKKTVQLLKAFLTGIHIFSSLVK